MLTRVTFLLVLVALADGGATTALARSGSRSTPITKAEADAFAQAVNLRVSDLPGATALHGAIFGPGAVQYEALRCGRQGKLGVDLVVGGEAWLTDSQRSVASIVAVAPSQHVAKTALATLGSQRGRICLTRALGSALTFEWHHELEARTR